jgi:hypothetical protein
MFLDSCIFECESCKEYDIGGRNMKEDISNNESGSKNTDSKTDTSNIDYSINDLETRDKIPSIEDILPDGEVFSYPLLDEYLGGSEKKEGVLEEAVVVNGGFGESVTLKLDGNMFRSNSKTVVGQVKKLLELKEIPVRVSVAYLVGKSGRKYFTLRG